MKENTGIDTETYKGYAKLICDDSGRYLDINDFDDIIVFLTHLRFRNKFNWFFNIKFDFEAIVKYLDYGTLVDLYMNKEVDYQGYIIRYLDKKFFSIRSQCGNYYYFYDLYNFLDTSLNKAAEKFLGDKKLDNIDAGKLNLDLDYWDDQYFNIVKYCIQDASLTKRLADHFWNLIYENMHYYPKRPFSKGKIAEEYFLHKCYIPHINDIDLKVLEFAYNSYAGGRFELLRKGYFDKVYSYDIKSAYPFQMTTLLDYSKGKWIKTKSVSKDAHTGFYLCKIESMEPQFTPFVMKISMLNIYPNGKMKIFLTKQEIEFIESRFENVTIIVEKGYEFFPKELKYPFKDEMEHLYTWKEKEVDENIKWCVKIFMNSLYGKTIQVSGDNQTGKLFNPIYAALITSGARIKLLETGVQNPESIIMFSTDAIHSTEKLKTPSHPSMGDFALDFTGEGVYIMSDVYNLWTDKKAKNKLRGFSLAMTKDIDSDTVMLKDILATMQGTKYSYTTKRPYHLGECLIHNKTRRIEDLNVFAEVKKNLDINGDKKRIWLDDFKSGKHCLKTQIDSFPILIE